MNGGFGPNGTETSGGGGRELLSKSDDRFGVEAPIGMSNWSWLTQIDPTFPSAKLGLCAQPMPSTCCMSVLEEENKSTTNALDFDADYGTDDLG